MAKRAWILVPATSVPERKAGKDRDINTGSLYGNWMIPFHNGRFGE